MLSPAPGRSARDKKLALATGVLILAGLFELVGDSLRLSEFLLSPRIPVENTIAGWLEVIRSLPVLTAVALALVAFVTAGEARRRWLRWAFLLAALGYGIGVVAGVLDYSAIVGPGPHGYRIASVADVLARLSLCIAALLAASAFSASRDVERREATMRRAAQAVAASFAFAAISAFEYAVAYSHYPRHNDFAGGLVVQGLGALGVTVAAMIGATAFRRRTAGGDDRPLSAVRERRLFRAAVVLVLAFLLVALGEGQTAAGTTAVGYAESSAVASWVFAVARVVYAAAVACAAVGFRAAARRD